jgi:hypothetical protein
MKLNRRLNLLTEAEYQHLLANYRRYTDFNSLGLFRSLLENEKLNPEQRLRLRDAAIEVFPKFYEFLQLKDPHTYFRLSTLGQELTIADERAAWQLIRQAQQRLLADKGIRHRNLGSYARHDCGQPDCPYNGVMVRQGSWLADGGLHFGSDHRSQWQRLFADQRQKAQRTFRNARQTRWPEDL